MFTSVFVQNQYTIIEMPKLVIMYIAFGVHQNVNMHFFCYSSVVLVKYYGYFVI